MLSLFNSFRVRLLLLLAALLVLTLSVQYYVNVRAVRRNAQFIAEQQQAIMAGFALGVNSLSSAKYLYELRAEAKQPLLGEQTERVKNILRVDDQGNIRDSLEKDQAPRRNQDTSISYVKVKDISLPPLNPAVELRSDNTPLPEGMTIGPQTKAGEPGAFYFAVDTTDGRRYIIVVLGSAGNLTTLLERQTRKSQLYTLAVLLVTTCLDRKSTRLNS